jgi:hypothetical protein
MRHTCDTAATAVVRERVCLLTPSVSVCAVVCVRIMTCVTRTDDIYTDMWRFSTSTHGWERMTNTFGAGPSARYQHVMTSVGLDLWIHGGIAYGDWGSTELWRFDTSALRWERVDNTVGNGAAPGPSGRYLHVMTSTGLNLWIHGGLNIKGEGDTYTSRAPLLY